MPHPLSDEVGRLRAALAAQALAFEERDQLWEKHASGMKRVAEGLWGIFEEEDAEPLPVPRGFEKPGPWGDFQRTLPPEARSAEAGPSATRASEEAGFVGDPRSAKKKIAGDGKKSKYTGVFYKRGLWQASTRENLKRRDWGSYATEIEAARAYDARAREMGNLFSLNFPTDDELKLTRKGESQYCGVGRRSKKWLASISIDRKSVHIGTYDTEMEAALAFDARARVEGRWRSLNFPNVGDLAHIPKHRQDDYLKDYAPPARKRTAPVRKRGGGGGDDDDTDSDSDFDAPPSFKVEETEVAGHTITSRTADGGASPRARIPKKKVKVEKQPEISTNV